MKEGDIVKQVRGFVPWGDKMGLTKLGIVVEAPEDMDVGVEFYELTGGHNCGNRCKQGKGWFINSEFLELVEEY